MRRQEGGGRTEGGERREEGGRREGRAEGSGEHQEEQEREDGGKISDSFLEAVIFEIARVRVCIFCGPQQGGFLFSSAALLRAS